MDGHVQTGGKATPSRHDRSSVFVLTNIKGERQRGCVIVSSLSDEISSSRPTRALNSIYSIRALNRRLARKTVLVVLIIRHTLHKPGW
jgi:hypothetical protein